MDGCYSKLDYALNSAKPQGEDYTYYSSRQSELLQERSDFKR